MKWGRVRIGSIGWELAPDIVTSAELELRLEPFYSRLRIQPGQLEAMTGIRERRWWPAGFRVSEGAARAAIDALARADYPAHRVDALVYAGVCREHFEPATACHVAAALGELGHPISAQASLFDVSNACLGALDAIAVLANRIELGQIRAGLVVTCESAREIVEWTIARMLGADAASALDVFRTGVATLTGGSGAVAILVSELTPTDSSRRLVGAVSRSDPRHHWLCRWGFGDEGQYMSTDSVGVLEQGLKLGAVTFEAFTELLGWGASEIDRSVAHQVGAVHRLRMLAALGLEEQRDFVAFDYLGNTGSVALPLAAGLAEQRGFLRSGHRVALLGIGSGLNSTAMGVEW